MFRIPHAEGSIPLLLLVDASNIGGIERHVQGLAQAFANSPYTPQIVLVNHYATNLWRQDLSASELDFIELDGRFGSVLKLLKATKASSAAPVVLHTHGYKAGIMGRLAAKLCHVAVLSSFHAGETAPFPVSLYQWLDVKTSFLSTRIAVSEAIARSLPTPNHLVPNGVAVPSQSPSQTPAIKRIAFVGRASFEKAPDLFCQLAKRCASQTLEFVLYGDGPMLAELQTQFSPWVCFKGMVENMRSHWRDIDLLLLPSRAEGLPMAALEAMSHGVPVLASTVGDLPKLITHGQTGWLCQNADINSLEAHLNTICALPPAQRHGVQRGAQSRIAQNYSLDATAEALDRLYQLALEPLKAKLC